jgi:predicted RNA-binding protein YlxR (DUF448 family)
VYCLERPLIKDQRSDIDRKCSVTRMARPRRGIYRFTEELDSALSPDLHQVQHPTSGVLPS